MRDINKELAKLDNKGFVLPKQQLTNDKDKFVSVYCDRCFGSGWQRFRNEIGYISYKPCGWCRGIGKRMALRGSGAERIGRKIIPGLWPHNPYKSYR